MLIFFIEEYKPTPETQDIEHCTRIPPLSLQDREVF